MDAYLDFEKPIATLEKKLEDLRELSKQQGGNLDSEIKTIEKKVNELIEEIYSKLTPWQRVQISRHPNRPYTRDYIENLFPDFMELHGDRGFADDPAITAGIASWPPQLKGSTNNGKSPKASVLILGHQKGRTTKQKMIQNFGMAKPEGYRKAIRLMDLAERMRIPIITFVDTPGAYPGLETEERGQAQAIAQALEKMFSLTVPVITVIIGEGGSGGALAIGCGNKVLMMEYSTYSVISPEGCASILWSDASYSEKASECLKMSPSDLLKLDVIDDIIKEPKGGAHRDWNETFKAMARHLISHLDDYWESDWVNIYGPASSASAESKSKKVKVLSKVKKTSKKSADKNECKYSNKTYSSDALKLRTGRFEKFRKMGLESIEHAKK